jgi:tripartite-type tricarboxylate transporter receptor subunit TctC
MGGTMMWRRASCAVAILMLVPPSALAQAWPTRQPIKVIIPFSAGSATDLVPRAVLEQVGKQIGQTFVIENRTGGSGTIGVREVARAEPDGYTVLVHSTTFAVSASTHPNSGYDARKDFATVSVLASLPNVLVVTPDKYKSLKELVDAARTRPGALNYASVGGGSAAHLNAERMMMAAGIKVQHVPFRGGPEALNEIMAGRVDFYFVPLPPARGLIAGQKVAALAVSGSERASALPDIPTTVEAGLPNSEYNFWTAMFVPTATSKDIVSRLNAEVAKALQDPGVKERLAKIGADPVMMNPAQAEAFVRKEIDINAALVKAAGVDVMN